jgi:hypothetical protein
MTCEDLLPFTEGALTAAERPAFHRHLAACGSCQRALQGMMLLDALATSLADGSGNSGAEQPVRQSERTCGPSLMTTSKDKTAQLGDLIAVAFEEAQRLTSDPRRAAALAAAAVRRILLIRGDAHLMRLLASN